MLRLGANSTQPLLLPPGTEQIAQLTQPIPRLPDWLQAELPDPIGGTVSAVAGPVVLERALLAAGDLPTPGADGVIRVPPALLFHVGHAEPGNAAVRFAPETVPAGRALYGPDLPFPPGVYDVVLAYETAGADLAGHFRVLAGERLLAEADVASGSSECRLPALAVGAEPLRFEFHYAGRASVALREIRLAPATLTLAPAR